MKRFGFQFKLTIAFIILLVTLLVFSTYFTYQRTIAQQKEELRSKILGFAKLASMLIDVNRHSQIKPEAASQNTPAYKEIKTVLGKIRDIDPLIDSVYTMVKSDKENIWMFVVDSGDTRGISAYCGEPYDVSDIPEMKLAFSQPGVDKEPMVDKWGVWLSGYAPLLNQQGEAVAIVGMDVSSASIKNMQFILAKRLLWVLILGIVFSWIMSWLLTRSITSPLHKLIIVAREVEKGNFDNKVEVNSKDEIQELAVAFNLMTEGLKESQMQLHRNYLNTIKSLALALEVKDPYTHGHSERVKNYSIDVARILGLSEQDIRLLEDVCILHDIGKIGIPENILSKPGPLSKEEWVQVKMHPLIGEKILQDIDFLKPGLSIVRDHHERPDGTGYPNNLKREEIPLMASIVAVADAFDAMTSDRPYRKAHTIDEALAILKDNKGTQFDSRVVDTFIEYFAKGAK
jgi:HAMP domain-containing protein